MHHALPTTQHNFGYLDAIREVFVTRRCSTVSGSFSRALQGIAPYEAILRARIQHARELLALTDLSMARIADMAGFSGAEYLSAVFKKQVGISPRSYRERKRGSRERVGFVRRPEFGADSGLPQNHKKFTDSLMDRY